MALKIADLKKADLQAELDKRGLDKTGLKSVLIDRLKGALEDEGKDPEEYEFESKLVKRDTEEDIDGSEGNFKYSFDKSMDEREDTPCSDEEIDDYIKAKEDTESARFKTWTQRQDVSMVDVSGDSVSEAVKSEANEESAKEKSTNDVAAPAEESADAKGGKGKVLKVIGKDKVQQVALTARTLWVTNLVSTSKVSDLKNLFSKHGKVTSAKIVRSTKGTQRKWYGLLTMTTSKDASKCIEKLHRTEFGGHIISVERRQIAPILKKSELSTTKKLASKSDVKDGSSTKADGSEKKLEENEPDDDEEKGKGGERRRSPDRGYRSHESKSYFRGRFQRGSFRRPFGGGYRGRGTSFRGRFNSSFRRPYGRPPAFERSSFRPFSRGGGGGGGNYHYERERDFREDRMREEEMLRHKMIVRKQKEEAYRLEKEKNQLRFERELLEREKAEMLKMERAKQRMEREQIEMEREKLRRHAEMRDAPPKRPYNRRGGGPPRREPPPYDGPMKRDPPPFDGPSSSFHREKFTSDNKFEYSRDHSSSYNKKPSFGHEDFRREKMDMPPKYVKREERREVTYHGGGPERRVYTRNEFRGPAPGPSFSPRDAPHFPSRGKPPREDWKFNEYRSGDKPGYAPRGRKMGGYY